MGCPQAIAELGRPDAPPDRVPESPAAASCRLGGAVAGLMMAPFYRLRPVRWLAIALRSVHELFWALILMQIAGIGVTTGILAIALPAFHHGASSRSPPSTAH